jgi:hypothetical protein
MNICSTYSHFKFTVHNLQFICKLSTRYRYRYPVPATYCAPATILPAKREARSVGNAHRIWLDFGSALTFQTRLTHTEPVLPLPNEHGSQVKDQPRRQCCHTKHEKCPYRPTRDVSLFSGHGDIFVNLISLDLLVWAISLHSCPKTMHLLRQKR